MSRSGGDPVGARCLAPISSKAMCTPYQQEDSAVFGVARCLRWLSAARRARSTAGLERSGGRCDTFPSKPRSGLSSCCRQFLKTNVLEYCLGARLLRSVILQQEARQQVGVKRDHGALRVFSFARMAAHVRASLSGLRPGGARNPATSFSEEGGRASTGLR